MLHYQEDVPNTNIVLELGEADFRVGLESGAEEEVGQGGRWRAVQGKQARCLHLLGGGGGRGRGGDLDVEFVGLPQRMHLSATSG